MIDSPAPLHASPSGDLQSEILRALAQTITSLGHPAEQVDLTLRPIPLEGQWGFGSAAAFQLRKFGAAGNPQELAERIASAIPALPQLQRVEAVNGYVNFYVNQDWYANRIIGQVLTQHQEYGCWPSRGERVMVEYANLNTHKTVHVGHLRNITLGNAIFNILRCAGFEAVGATYIGDIGMHVMRTMWGYLNFWKDKAPTENRGSWLEAVYVDSVYRLEYRSRVIELIEDAAKSSPAIAAHLTTTLQAWAGSTPEDAPTAQHIAETLLSKDGPDWKTVLAAKDYIVFNLWDALGQLLVAQPSTLDASSASAPALLTVGEDGGIDEAHPLDELRADYEKLDTDREYWDKASLWNAEIKQMFARWEAQDEELLSVWNETRRWSLDMLERVFTDLGVSFDAWFFESEVEEPGKEVVTELIEQGLAEDLRPEGPVIVRVDDRLRERPELSEKYAKELWKTNKDGTREPKEAWRVLVVLRSDGTSLYATKDLELARRKFNDWHVDRAIYVVDTRQALYLQQVFRVLELWGFPQAEKCHHLSYEHVVTPEGAISSRRGGAPQYEELEREALRRARAVVDAKEEDQPRDLTEQQKSDIAWAVAYGALKMGMLDKDNNKVITFEFEQALNPESQSATYVQYSHARATRVLEKAPQELLPTPGDTFDFTAPEVSETALLEIIARLPEEVARAAEAYKPVIIAMYCFELADAFNNFYHNCPILRAGSDDKVRARLALTAAAKQTIDNALGLLGITAPDIM
jgi:arginyl-tRNA synthetase